MKIRLCPSCGGRLVADIKKNKVFVQCTTCGRELEGLFRVCPSCGGRLMAHIKEDKVIIRCNDCGQGLGAFDRAYYPVSEDSELSCTCGHWVNDEDNGTWKCSICGLQWRLKNGTPEENHMHFCPKCGAVMLTKEAAHG